MQSTLLNEKIDLMQFVFPYAPKYHNFLNWFLTKNNITSDVKKNRKFWTDLSPADQYSVAGTMRKTILLYLQCENDENKIINENLTSELSLYCPAAALLIQTIATMIKDDLTELAKFHEIELKNIIDNLY